MAEFLLLCPALIAVITAFVLMIKFRKTKKPEKLSLVFAVIALVFGISFICFSLFPFEYTGEKGLDYIGQAMAWAMIMNAIQISLFVAYLSFAIAGTVYAFKAFKDKDKRKKGILALVVAWVCGVLIGSLITINAISDMNNKKNISVDVKDVAVTNDSEGKAAVVFTLELHNGSKRSITYLSSVYEEVTQYDLEIYYTPVTDLLDESDKDIKTVEPGESITIRKSYRLNDADGPVRIVCRSFDGRFIYVDSEFRPADS